jgi:hypothetical protein
LEYTGSCPFSVRGTKYVEAYSGDASGIAASDASGRGEAAEAEADPDPDAEVEVVGGGVGVDEVAVEVDAARRKTGEVNVTARGRDAEAMELRRAGRAIILVRV